MERYKVEILRRGECRLFLPVSVTYGEEGEPKRIVILKNGFARLGERSLLDAYTALGLLGIFADGMRDAAEHYLFPEDYEVNTETVYTDPEASTVKLAFRPVRRLAADRMVLPGRRVLPERGNGILPDAFREQVGELASLLIPLVNEEAAQAVRDGAALFREDGFGPTQAFLELAAMRKRWCPAGF